ncbi:kinase-like domain-containing protein [Rhizophagus irregularis DAOM 181602=DAOM 197198]|uniref:Kinase-like domain-containing protein n=1 Tax=Rhizophagus irregularis (strain DAOM 181602 / DAOM 197198 / MUCL 43194) TaxID=747089 RepID=A0A2P4QMW1_RHIID|nr:kinase-like domain-containing protein [Rhizophagus irregularis DAOM 181602=DAOM 197198]POG78979.1 kinase-like domain-containing protein [Rhizophagus irregularis DAOM 181602=DAOM 197198]|eukprot:XP_025185845.1 kinase-like domain-containing protein [Rhizophagus irregularis DAOM 181602=DAOM 197198]
MAHEFIYSEIHRAEKLAENTQNNKEKQYESIKQTILADQTFTSDERSHAIKLINKKIDKYKVRENKGTRRTCEICQGKCLATLYCEYCVRNYLIAQFSNWTSENDNIDNLIRECQMETLKPDNIIEWIPYNNLRSINYLTDCSKIYKAIWIDGYYDEWDSKENQLKRIGYSPDVVLKKLENVEKANKNWIDEAKSYLNICSKYGEILTCYGLTKDPSDGNYMLVMNKSHMNLREYLKRKHNEITWRERIHITDDLTFALSKIHKNGVIHKNLHSGNVLFNQRNKQFYITDLGFRGPADRPSNSIYGNLPYIAPEIISGKEITFASDIYSIGILMWEISFGKPPFIYQEDELFLAMNIINGIRPKIESGIPLEYKKLMMQCWDADPKRRPNIGVLNNKIFEMRKHCQNISNDSNSNNSKNEGMIKKFIKKLKVFQPKTNDILEISEISNLNETDYKLFTSKVYAFEDFPEPRNGTEEFHNQSYNFSNSNNIDDNIVKMMQSSSIFKGSSKVPQIYSNEDIQVDYKRETIQQTKNVDIKDEHELYSNPNLHSEDQDELEIPWII